MIIIKPKERKTNDKVLKLNNSLLPTVHITFLLISGIIGKIEMYFIPSILIDMRQMEEALRKIKSVLKVPGDGAPEVELKFRIGDSPEIQAALASLVENGTLNKYEFPPNSGSWHYKLKKKIDLDSSADDDGSNNGNMSSGQLKALSEIVEEIAKEIGDDFILNKVKEYKSKFNL